jgi:hypothetical protein
MPIKYGRKATYRYECLTLNTKEDATFPLERWNLELDSPIGLKGGGGKKKRTITLLHVVR